MSNVRRQYSLPNCTLVLDGLEGESLGTDGGDNRPILDILTNMECYFSGLSQKMAGGRTLLENLVKSVNSYAQECLSGLPHEQELGTVEKVDQVKLERIEASHLHRLTWWSEGLEKPQSLDLTTVQLFDLIEAIDQFVADNRTIPNLSVSLNPLPRRYRLSEESLPQRLVPATVGLLSLLIVASLGYLLPIPEVEKPTPTPTPIPTQSTPDSN